MRTIKSSSCFKKDFRRVLASPHHCEDLNCLLDNMLRLLVADEALPESCRDHALVGDWKGYRGCHIKPDLLLIYKYESLDILRLARLGSHSELFR